MHMKHEQPLKIAFVLPHPDDEALAFGLPAQLAAMGQNVQLISLTKGDLGSHTIRSRRKIARIRQQEFSNAGKLLGTSVAILGFGDGTLQFKGEKASKKLLTYLRTYQPDVVITTDKHDYHEDHRATHEIARWATFHLPDTPISTKQGILRKRVPAVQKQVAFYAMDTQGSQMSTNTEEDTGQHMHNLHPVNLIVAIDDTAIAKSIAAFQAHQSQVSHENGEKNYVALAYRQARRRGRQAGFTHGAALSFEPFGGYAFTTNNLLATIFNPAKTHFPL